MKVFQVRYDADTYVNLEYEDGRITRKHFDFRAKPKKDNWFTPNGLYLRNPMARKGDFYCVGISSFILRQSALNYLTNILESCSELLPMRLEDEEIYVVNILESSDCIDYDKTKFVYCDDTPYDIEKYSFDQRKMPDSSLFKLSFDRNIRIFTYEGVKENPEDEFKHVVESNNLKGLKFTLKWDSETE